MVKIPTIKDVLETMCNKSTITLPNIKENKLVISFKESSDVSTDSNGYKQPLLPFAASEVFHARIVDSRRLTAVDDGCKTVYEVTFDVAGSNFTFNPGDTIGIIPQNNSDEVDQIIDHLNLSTQADSEYSLSISGQIGGKLPPHIPAKSTLRHVLTHCCDLRTVMKKLFILALSKHTKDENERKILEYLSSKEGSTDYNTYILNSHFCILDLFSTFQTCRPPIELLLANLPRLLPRPYSIVNSGLIDPNIIKICFSVTELDRCRKGLVTGWLEQIINVQSDDIEAKLQTLSIKEENCHRTTVPIYIRKNISGFSMPEGLDTPLILIGPGTGVSPFIGFLEKRKYLKENCSDKEISDTWLFFGCRNPKLDFIYEEELNDYINCGILTKLSTSFSRIENSGTKYIQEAILQHAEGIVNLIEEGAVIFVCGNVTKMATQVKEALSTCFVQQGKTQEEADKLLSDLQAGKRLLVDAWS